MRPLNSKEHTHKKVWKVLTKYASVAQTTLEGKPLPERIAGRNFFTYDQTFDESSTTYQVYTAIAQPIVTTACTGRNGTIFAYGQTSSGKTYTMQGSGTIAEGTSSVINGIDNGNGGIVHMAAHDIFDHIASCPDRVFVVRASFLEIYNEEVRDLLQDYSNSNKVLQIREDPRRGVFVQSKEIIATDANNLLAVLWQGEKSRSFATTAMNERSSRSHTIFRITIESRSRYEDVNEDDDNEDTSTMKNGGGAVRVSTLNLVDLAGSESVRHTGATGDRQKEGGMINQRFVQRNIVPSSFFIDVSH
jgi:centromeric protein E